jgi:hypothetical protein
MNAGVFSRFLDTDEDVVQEYLVLLKVIIYQDVVWYQ